MLTPTLRWSSACIPDASFPWLSIFDITELSKVVRQSSSAFPLPTHDECNFYNSADGATDKGNKDAESRRPNNEHESPESAIDGAICSIEGMAMRSRHVRYKEDRSMALKVLRHNAARSHDISKWSPTGRLLSPVFKPWNAYGSSLNRELLSIRRMETTAENSGYSNASLTQRIRTTTSLQELANIFNQYTRNSLGDNSRDASLQPSSLGSAARAIRPTHLAQICGTVTRLVVELKTLSKSDMNLAVSLTEAVTRELTVCVSDLNVEDLCELMGSWACLNVSPSTTIKSEVLWWLRPTSGGRLRYASARHLASATRLLQRLGWLDSRLLALCVEAALKKSMTTTLDASSLAILMCSFWEVGHTDLKTYMSFSSLSNQLLPHMSPKELVTVLHTLSCAGASTLSHTFLSGSASKLLTFVDELTLEEVSFVANAFAKCSFSHEFLFSGLSRRALFLIEDEAGSMDKLDIADLDNLGRIAESYSILDLYSPQLFNGLERAGRQLLRERDAAASFTFAGLQPLQQEQREVAASKGGQPSLKKSSCVAWGSMQQVNAGPVRNAVEITQKRAMVQPANKFAGPSPSDVSHGGTHEVKLPSLSLLSRFAWSFSNSGHSAPLFLDHVADVLTSRDLIQGMNMASLGTLCEAYSTAKHRNNAFLAAIRRRATHFVSRFSNNASHFAEVGGGRDTESCFHPNEQFSSRQSSGSFASSFTLPPPLRSSSSAAALVSATDLRPSIQMLQILCLFGEDFEALLQVMLPTLCHALETEPVPQPILSNMTKAVAKDNYALDLQDLEALIQPLTLTIQCSSGLFNKSIKAIGNNRVSSKHAQNAALLSNMSLDEEEETSSSINMHYMTLLVDVLDRLQDAPPNGWRSLLRISQAQVGQAVMALKDLGAYEQLGGGSRWHHEEHCVSAYDQLFADSLLLQPLSLSRHELGNDKSTVSRGHVDDLRKCLQRELKELDLTSVVHHEKVHSQNLQSALVLVKVLGKTLAVDVWGPGMFPSNHHGSISRHATSGHLTSSPASADDHEASGSSDIRTRLPADPEDDSSSKWIDRASSLYHEDSASATALDDEVVVQTQGASGLTSTLTSMPYSTAVCPPGALSAARVRLQAMILKGWLPVVIPYWVIVQSGSKNMTHQLRDHLLRRITAALSMLHDNDNMSW